MTMALIGVDKICCLTATPIEIDRNHAVPDHDAHQRRARMSGRGFVRPITTGFLAPASTGPGVKATCNQVQPVTFLSETLSIHLCVHSARQTVWHGQTCGLMHNCMTHRIIYLSFKTKIDRLKDNVTQHTAEFSEAQTYTVHLNKIDVLCKKG